LEPAGLPPALEPSFHSRLMVGPATYHAPAAMPIHAPMPAIARCAEATSRNPPTIATTPGSTDSHSRPAVQSHVLSEPMTRSK